MWFSRRRFRALAWIGLAAALLQPPGAVAQVGVADLCQLLRGQSETTCVSVTQAVESGQPQLGILVAGGNPTLGTASTQGFRFGARSRMSATGQVKLVLVRLPDILAEGSRPTVTGRQLTVPAPALSGTAAFAVFPGVSVSPHVGGVGSVDLLGSLTWLPISLLDTEGFSRAGNPDLAIGVGARLGLLRESFTAPGASVSVMFRRLPNVGFGDVCPGTEVPPGLPGAVCAGAGDAGEFEFDLENWSTRAAISKRVVGFGLTGGVGYDRFSSDAAFAFRFQDPLAPAVDRVLRSPSFEITSDRWSAFVNASFTFLVATLAAEGGWMQGADPVPGFERTASEFDPRAGTFFGSVGGRISF